MVDKLNVREAEAQSDTHDRQQTGANAAHVSEKPKEANAPLKQKETVVNEDSQETTINQAEKETTVNEEVKETTINEEVKETAINEEQNKPKRPSQEENNDETKKDGPEVNRKDDDKEEDGDEEKGPFKKGDVIEYMYEDWLIGGANWLWAWSAKKIKKAYYKFKRNRNRAIGEKNKIKDIKRHDAYQWKEKYENKALNDAEEKTEKFEQYNGLVELCDKIRNGKVDETNLPDRTKALIKNMPKEHFDQFFDARRIKKCQENMKDNMIAAMQFSNLYATVAMVDPKMQDKGFTHEGGNDKAFNRLKKEGLALYVKAMSREAANGGNTQVLSGKLLDLAQNAVEQMDKDLENGRFDGFQKKHNGIWRRFYRKITNKHYGEPRPNTAFTQLNEMLQGIDANEPPVNFQEALLMQQDFDKGIANQLENLTQQENATEARRQQLEYRKRQLQEAKARMLNDPEKKRAREEKETNRAQKREALRQRLLDKNYVSTVGGQQDQKLTDFLRQRLNIDRGH